MPRNQKVTGRVWTGRQAVEAEVTITGTRDQGYVEEGHTGKGKDRQLVQKGIYGENWLFDKKRAGR